MNRNYRSWYSYPSCRHWQCHWLLPDGASHRYYRLRSLCNHFPLRLFFLLCGLNLAGLSCHNYTSLLNSHISHHLLCHLLFVDWLSRYYYRYMPLYSCFPCRLFFQLCELNLPGLIHHNWMSLWHSPIYRHWQYHWLSADLGNHWHCRWGILYNHFLRHWSCLWYGLRRVCLMNHSYMSLLNSHISGCLLFH